LLSEAHLDFEIELVPWKRAYKNALDRPNTLIYTIAKTESRKDQFIIHDDDGYYIAASLKTEPSVLKSLMASCNRLVKSGFIEKIVSEYLAF
jgi:hypothetical protein